MKRLNVMLCIVILVTSLIACSKQPEEVVVHHGATSETTAKEEIKEGNTVETTMDNEHQRVGDQLILEWKDSMQMAYGLQIEWEIQGKDGIVNAMIKTNENLVFEVDDEGKKYMNVTDDCRAEDGKLIIDFKEGYRPISFVAGADVARFAGAVMYFPVSDFHFSVRDMDGNEFATPGMNDYLNRYDTGWWGYAGAIDWDNHCTKFLY